MVTLDLTINTTLTGTDIITTCGSYTWIDGTTYTSSNYVATDTLTSLGGCDSIVYLNLTIVPNISTTDQIAACGSYTWINGITYTSSNYSDTVVLSSQSGCDSVVTLDLTINTPASGTDVITACGSYTWIDGTTYTSSTNTATTILTASNGCDSMVTLDLTINTTLTGTDIITTCGSYTWIDGTTYTSSNYVATDTLTSLGGCDSIVYLNLTIVPNISTTDQIAACGSYTWINGITYTSSNYSDTVVLSSQSGCDSVVTLDLTINTPASGTDVITACGSYTWIDGTTYTSSTNTATTTLTASNGCDSVVTLDLTINTPASGTDVITACGSYTWIDGTTYTSSTNTATTTLTASNGCDSVVTLDLTINTNLTGTDIITTCGSYTWIDGTTYTSSNYVATDTLSSLGGCDSIVYLNLTIVPNISTTDQIAACGSYTWINGITYTSSNYSDTVVLSSQSGCDSVITLDLTINPPYTGTDVITACESYTWIDGNTYTASNNSATHLLTGANGCDSTVTLNLTINNTSTGTDVISACGSYTWIDGTTYTSSTNTATTILTASNGCDSVVTLDLTINTPASGTDVITACGSYTWIDGTTYTSSTNTATTILTASNGCDSIVTLDLTINSPVTSTEVVTACGSYTWIDGNTYTSSDTSASITFTASNGCDSAVNLDLTIIPPANSVDSVTACGSYTWIDGNTYTSNNSTAIDTLIGSNGCDSIVTLNLVITNTFSTTEVISACVSYTWINGITYTSSNTDSVLLIASNGCDSILYLNLTILQSKSSIDSVQACNSFTWINGVTYLSDNNNASVTYTAQNGCDSVVYLDLTISNINTAVQASGDTLVAPPNQTFYQWMRCETGSYSPIAGATSNTFTPTSKGQYAVRIVNGACTDTSSCVFFSGLGMNESKLSIKIYPNPSKGILNIKSDILFIGIKIYDSSGREVFDSKIEQPSEELSLNLENLKSGFYSIQLIGEERVYSETLIISY
jgi:3'-phosphoadenosine 5'-phosphosulfate sulfotransferase (PAPS reductase)/FAD synthetase